MCWMLFFSLTNTVLEVVWGTPRLPHFFSMTHVFHVIFCCCCYLFFFIEVVQTSVADSSGLCCHLPNQSTTTTTTLTPQNNTWIEQSPQGSCLELDLGFFCKIFAFLLLVLLLWLLQIWSPPPPHYHLPTHSTTPIFLAKAKKIGSSKSNKFIMVMSC